MPATQRRVSIWVYKQPSAVNQSDLTAKLKRHISSISPQNQEAKCQRPRIRTQFSKLTIKKFLLALLRNSRRLWVALGCWLLAKNYCLYFRKFLFNMALVDTTLLLFKIYLTLISLSSKPWVKGRWTRNGSAEQILWHQETRFPTEFHWLLVSGQNKIYRILYLDSKPHFHYC